MTGFRTEGWLDIAAEARRLTRAIADMEWEDQDPSAERALLAQKIDQGGGEIGRAGLAQARLDCGLAQ